MSLSSQPVGALQGSEVVARSAVLLTADKSKNDRLLLFYQDEMHGN